MADEIPPQSHGTPRLLRRPGGCLGSRPIHRLDARHDARKPTGPLLRPKAAGGGPDTRDNARRAREQGGPGMQLVDAFLPKHCPRGESIPVPAVTGFNDPRTESFYCTAHGGNN
ncbi:predicted protein [Streptomyces sp. C]|nr:predicted protein [Streptomyces sp. C]